MSIQAIRAYQCALVTRLYTFSDVYEQLEISFTWCSLHKLCGCSGVLAARLCSTLVERVPCGQDVEGCTNVMSADVTFSRSHCTCTDTASKACQHDIITVTRVEQKLSINYMHQPNTQHSHSFGMLMLHDPKHASDQHAVQLSDLMKAIVLKELHSNCVSTMNVLRHTEAMTRSYKSLACGDCVKVTTDTCGQNNANNDQILMQLHQVAQKLLGRLQV